MISVAFLRLNFGQILTYFLSLMDQVHMGFIATSERTHFGLGKLIFIFPESFLHVLGEQGKL